jgi:hypothetical protein
MRRPLTRDSSRPSRATADFASKLGSSWSGCSSSSNTSMSAVTCLPIELPSAKSVTLAASRPMTQQGNRSRPPAVSAFVSDLTQSQDDVRASASSSTDGAFAIDRANAAERERHRLELDDIWKKFQSAKKTIDRHLDSLACKESDIAALRRSALDQDERITRLECERSEQEYRQEIATRCVTSLTGLLAAAAKRANEPTPIRDSELLRALRRAELRIAEIEKHLPPGLSVSPGRAEIAFSAGAAVGCAGGRSGLRAVANCRELLCVPSKPRSTTTPFRPFLEET